jgi:hypothetical protein
MTLEQYFSKHSAEGDEPTPGVQTPWLDFCDITLKGASFLVVDASFLPSEEDGVVVKAPRGRYIVQAKVMDYGCDRRISRLRVMVPGSDPELGEELGDTWTDTAQTAICDFEVFSAAWGDDDDEAYEKISDDLMDAESFGVAVLDDRTGAAAPFVSSGFGDGSFPVFELREGKRRVGFEIEFIKEGERYPFGKDSAEKESTSTGEGGGEEAGGGKSPDLLKRLGEAILGAKIDPSAPKEERKAQLGAVFKQLEDEFRAEAEGACTEYRQHVRQVRAKASPPRMIVQPAQDESFVRAAEAQERIAQLTQAGFVPAGLFETLGSSGAKLAAFLHAEHRVYAVLTFSKDTIDCDIDADYPDGTEFLVTSATRYAWMQQPPWKTTLRTESKTIAELLQVFLENAPKQERGPVSAEQFARALQPNLNRAMDWRNDIGGLDRDELKALLVQQNPAKATDDEGLSSYRLDTIDRALFNWLRIQDNLGFDPNGVMDNLIIVHEELAPELLATAYWAGTGDFKAKAADFSEGGRREAFGRVVAERGAKLRKVAEKKSGLPADYYLPA